MSARGRWWKRGAWVAFGLSFLWVGFTLLLDLRYDMLPRTTLGGLKILAAAWVLLLVLLGLAAAARFLARAFRQRLQSPRGEG